jgi:D-aminopeptidase
MNEALTPRLETLIRPLVRADGPGLAAGVLSRGRPLLQLALGQADLKEKTPFTPATPTPIASISKSLTSLCALRLARRGLLEIDAPLGRYLPALPSVARRPTLRQLMTHTSGLRCHLDLELFGGYAEPRPDGFGLRTHSTLTTANAPPDAWRMYGNSGHHLLSLAIEQVTGRCFSSVLAEEVLTPLGLGATRLLAGAGKAAPGLAHAYAPDAAGWADVSGLRSELLGEGGLGSTLEDLLKWAEALRTDDPRIESSLWRALKRPAPAPDDAPGGYALGLTVQPWRGVELIGHGGSLIGVSAAMWVAPALGLSVAILANTAIDAEGLARALLAEAAEPGVLAPEPPFVPASEHRGLLGGVYADEVVVVGVDAVGETLGFALQGAPAAPLRRGPDGAPTYLGPVGPYRLRLSDDADAIVFEGGGESRRLIRRPPASNINEAASQLAGRYANEEIEATLEICFTGAGLSVRSRNRHGAADGQATPLAEDIWRVSTGAATYLLRPTADGVAVSTPRTRGLAFKRTSERPQAAQEQRT